MIFIDFLRESQGMAMIKTKCLMDARINPKILGGRLKHSFKDSKALHSFIHNLLNIIFIVLPNLMSISFQLLGHNMLEYEDVLSEKLLSLGVIYRVGRVDGMGIKYFRFIDLFGVWEA